MAKASGTSVLPIRGLCFRFGPIQKIEHLILPEWFTLFKTLAISFSTMTLFTRIAPPYGSSLLYAEPDLSISGLLI
ncbi:hypothetical protein NC653_013143 [Populus alba x Populus x berolinensis]|uniref:Uncharacterized protein n=1 Tax=Populus alba x Populus x berolinensis TaxID=444605 RepID=A0AAD6QU20_9ROSI|nr:hypothetical protein NC653_013143 [Populus alba x Populus x berolinensis]